MKVILCDLGNVLVGFDHRIASRRILPYTRKPFEEVHRLFFDSPDTKAYEEGRLTSRQFYRRMVKKIGLNGLSYGRFSHIWNEIFFANRPMVRLLKRLGRRYRLYLISNISKLHYDYIARMFPDHLAVFDKVYLSYRIGARKPHPAIYRRALSGIPKEAVLYTDDRRDLIAFARSIGIKSIRFIGVDDFARRLKTLGVLP